MEFRYVNNNGKEIGLSDWPFCLQSDNIVDYEWSYDATNIGQNRAKIRSFYKTITEISSTIAIHAATEAEFNAALNQLLEVTEEDILNISPGRLYCNDCYLKCYICSGSTSKWKDGIRFALKDITIVAEYPFWITESLTAFRRSGSVTGEGKIYDYTYPFTYSTAKAEKIINSHYGSSEFKLIVYGPAQEPNIRIAGHVYTAKVEINDGERLEINSLEGTIVKIDAFGDIENCFNDRGRESDIFQKIPSGLCEITQSGNYDFDLIVYTERSEPIWTL